MRRKPETRGRFELPDRERARPLLRLIERFERRHADHISHGEEVARFCTETARELGLDQRRSERLGLAGALHDIGKFALDDAVIDKPGPLSAEEWTDVRRHPSIGAEMLRGAGLEELAEWVESHHERIDGRGYPRGTEDGEIPLEARVLAVADAYQTMVKGRVYRAAVSHDEASVELRRCSGTQFDGPVVEAFLKAVTTANA